MSTTPRKLTKAEAISKLWDMGNLTYKMHSAQVDMYNRIKDGEDIIRVIACSRGWGKSFALLVIAFETCLNKPNAIVKYAAPTAKDLNSIVMDNFKKVMEDCPKKYAEKIKWKVQEKKIVFEHNGSEIHLAGVEKGNFEKLRGATADLCIIDEAGFCDKLDYIVKSVMFPMIARGKGDIRAKRIVMASTPSKSNDHDFISYMRDYEFKNKLVKYTIHENPLMEFQAKNSGFTTTEEFIRVVILAPYPDGVEANAYKREFLCQIINSEEDAVIPEFSSKEVQDACIKEWPEPPHYDAYVSMDIGFKDLTVVLFAYYDFQNAKLVIKDELVLSGTKMLTDNLALEIKMKESANFMNKLTGDNIKPFLRVSDNNNPILLQDLSVKHGISFMATAKDDKDAALNNMRMHIKAGKIIINPRCKTLISHLKGAVWNSARTSFARSPDKGHYDAADSLCYLCRNVNFQRNPFPKDSYNPSNYHLNNQVQEPSTPFESFVKNAFTPKLGGRRRR
jgi:Terminase large subunit, T4likevirus-type, N-terminal